MYMVVDCNNLSLGWSITVEKHTFISIITRFLDKDGNKMHWVLVYRVLVFPYMTICHRHAYHTPTTMSIYRV